MAVTTAIPWCHHTFNGWIGCWKISDGCKFCYAAVDTYARVSRSRGGELWGKDAARHVTSEANWRKPLAWDRAASEAGERRRVFTASLSDVFEDRPELVNPRIRLFDLIERTPNLDWLLLTKRPESARAWVEGSRAQGLWPLPNVWLGVSVENQAAADQRIPVLLSIPARVRFLSCEPLLGPLDLMQWLEPTRNCECGGMCVECCYGPMLPRIHWAIAGGESGPNARPCDVGWIGSVVEQCKAAGVPVFVKQLGSCPVATPVPGYTTGLAKLRDPKGGDPAEWPEDLRVREFPETPI